MVALRKILSLCVALLLAPSVSAADPWHLAGWQARAVVEIPKPLGDAIVDTAAVKALCQGLAMPDGGDYRVLDAAGKPVPFQLTFHDAGRYSLIAFRATYPRQKFFVYFGNPQAARAPEQVVDTPAPGSGPPKGDWVPRAGLVYQTIARPRAADIKMETNPNTVEELAKVMAASPRKFGARYQRNIADGYNPFGPSDYYISIYRGWVRIPKAGKYQFCTASNEASFSFLDGKELIHWPGRHTAERGMRGEKNAAVELTAGLHYMEYYHEEVTLEQMAFLGWRPSPDPGPFEGIPEAIFTLPHQGVVVAYDTPKGPLLAFEPVITDSIWPSDRQEGQYTRCRFAVSKVSTLPPGTTFHWDFGDGQAAAGAEVEHVYLTLGSYQVSLTVAGPAGKLMARWPLEVYEIENITDQFKEGKPKDYARLARAYDRSKLEAGSLKELAFLLAESEDFAAATEVGKEYVQRFGNTKPQAVGQMRRLLADCAIRLGKENLDEAIANYHASITKATPAAEKLDVLARLIRLVGIERGQPEKAGKVLAQVEETVKAGRLDTEGLAAYRRAMIAAGDVLLWHAKPDGARDLYKRAEALTENPPPANVRAARIGAYPSTIREYLTGGNYGAALDIVNKWEEAFPTDKIHGHTFWWRGKLLSLRGQHRDAARYLARSIGLAEGADFESEARWLLALSLEQIGRQEDSRRELARLIRLNFGDEFTKRARAKLQKPAGTKP